jgi:predicted MFS family arabinose efflux permease
MDQLIWKSPEMSAAVSHPQGQRTATKDRLPLAPLLALAMTGFVAIMTETLPAGLLPLIGQGLHVSQAMAGQLVTVYAAGSLVAAIPLVAATQTWRRRPVLLLAIGGLFAFNTVTALSGFYTLTLAARFLAGVAAGLAWGMIAGYARRLVAPELQGRALALAMVGTPVALSIGTPAGSLLGGLAGWRAAFLVMSGLTLLLAGWVLWAVPDRPGQETGKRRSIGAVLAIPGILPVLLVVFAWMLAHNVLYTYAAPFVARAGLGGRVDLILLVFGVAAFLGIWVTGLIVDRWLRASVLISLAVFALVCVVLAVFGHAPAVVLGAVAVWGLTFGGASTLLNTASADTAGDAVDVAAAMVTTAWNMAIAGGGIVGGLLLNRFGPASFAYAMLIAVLAAIAVVWRSNKHGFPPGPRGGPTLTR